MKKQSIPENIKRQKCKNCKSECNELDSVHLICCFCKIQLYSTNISNPCEKCKQRIKQKINGLQKEFVINDSFAGLLSMYTKDYIIETLVKHLPEQLKFDLIKLFGFEGNKKVNAGQLEIFEYLDEIKECLPSEGS